MTELDEKLAQSRLERSTSPFYDSYYWNIIWSERFGVTFDSNDKSNKFENEKKKAWLDKILGAQKGSLLDVGCSMGYFVTYMRTQGWDAHGIDISEYAISKSDLVTLPFLKIGSATELPYADNSFDVVTAFDVLEHLYIEQIFKAIKELARVCKSDIVIRVPSPGFIGEQFIDQSFMPSLEKSHISIYPWEFWSRRFNEVGFRHLVLTTWVADSPVFGNLMESWMFFKKVKSE